MSKLRNELEALRYMDLKDKFIELGIGEVFKGGVKKVVLIETAISTLENMETGKTVKEVIAKVAIEEKIIKEEIEIKNITAFEKSVLDVIANKEFWTKESMEKRMNVYGNIFNQHRGTPKGDEVLLKQEVLQEVIKRIY